MGRRTLDGQQHRRHAWRVLDSEAVVVELRTSTYYSLNKTGTYVLARLVGGEKPDAIGATLAERLSVTPSAAASAVSDFLRDLLDAGLLIEESSAGQHVFEDELTVPAEYETPELTRHARLEQLILSGE
jgi:hypothetical protein